VFDCSVGCVGIQKAKCGLIKGCEINVIQVKLDEREGEDLDSHFDICHGYWTPRARGLMSSCEYSCCHCSN
jgi:hypothetical protein